MFNKRVFAKQHQPRPVALAVAFAMMGAAVPVFADDAAPAKDEAVVVTGIRASLKQSLTQKRNADSIVEVITAEDVGKMPDKNVADSLQRVAGVNVAAAGAGEGSFGENDRVALRGTPFALTLTTLNGHTVSSGDWFADNIVNGGRSVSFSLFPSELIGQVVVHKGSQADLLEGGAMGVVDIQTRKPLDFKNQINGQVSIGGVYSENSKKTDPQINGLFAWKNDQSTIGVLVQGFHEKRTLSRAGQENQIWYDKVVANSPIANAIPGSVGTVTSYLGGTAWFEQERTRNGGLIDVQFKPSADVSFDVTGFYSHLDAPNINHNFMQSVGLFGGNADRPYPTGNITGSAAGGILTSLNINSPAGCGAPCAGLSSAVQEEFSRPIAESKSQFVNLDGKVRVNDKLTLAGKLGTSKGVGNTVSGALGVWMPWTGGGYQIRGVDQAVIYNTPGADKFSIGGNQATPYTYGSHVTATDTEDYGQVDGTYKLDLGTVQRFKFGARVARHERELTSIGIKATDALSNVANLPMNGLTAFPTTFNDLGANGAGYWTFSQDAVNGWLSQYAYYDGHLRQSEFDIKEPTESAYAMAEFGGEGFSGNFGVRLVHTKEDVTRYEIGPSGSFEPRNYINNYVDVLPSANFKLDLSRNLDLRFALSRTMARPELGQMAGVDLRDVQGFGTVGNPNLKPIRSNNAEVTTEWYFGNDNKSLLAASLFYSSLDGYVTYGSGTATFYNQLKGENTVYQVATPVNTTAEVKGLELAYQQALWGGFGVNANYTHTIGKETGKAPGSQCGALTNPDCTMIGTSKNAYNLGAFYEDDKFSARMTYSWRSGFLNGLSRNNSAFQDSIGTLSLSLGYQINPNLSISLDGKDINNPMVRSIIHTPGAGDLPGALYKNGAQYYLTLHAKY
ncbi:TonB-dependent receptor [Chitinimonas sp.]|uniref:TonB-dependent receptor n=1 Tax=Chitinimonas sp. TaxID=1934313 RepID=UPI002F929743